MGGVDFRDQTRLPVLRIESCEDLKRLRDWRRLAGYKRMVGKQTKFKISFLRRPGGQGPASALPKPDALLPFVQLVPSVH